MKKFLLVIFLICGLCAFASENYNLYSPNAYKIPTEDIGERILFILDFSNSMTQSLGDERKIDMMLSTMAHILPTIGKNTWVGLRVYGHKSGFTAMDACRASSLLVPVMPAGSLNIQPQLQKTKARGMTPITFSLKKAVEGDFAGFSGKKHIILLTDGGENCDESPCLWAMELIKTRKDVIIDVVAFNINDKEDLDQLSCTALVTSGRFYTANTSSELVDSMQKSLHSKKQVEAKIILNK